MTSPLVFPELYYLRRSNFTSPYTYYRWISYLAPVSKSIPREYETMSDLDKKAQGEVKTPTITSQSSGPAVGEVYNEHEHEHEPFAASPNGVNFRTVGWIRASIFFLKMTFAAGILSITPALYELGAVLGAIMILFWGLLNTYMAVIQGQFKMHHPSVHTVSDSAHIAAMELTGGKKGCARMAREVTEFIYILAWILAAGLSILGLSTAFNAVTHHETCTALSLASAHASSSRLSEACGRSISWPGLPGSASPP